jgi:undecaprenyl-diphosphatase
VTNRPIPSPPPAPQHPPFFNTQTSSFIFGLSAIIILGMFYFLAQLDFPTVYLHRSFEHSGLDQIGNVGNRLGDAVTLVFISLAIGAIGYIRHSKKLKMLCFHSLLAHGLVGLFAQIIKHSLGRPRPRHMDKGPWEIGPSFEIGYDSFPSGHASASFAVATVLAYYFPKGKFLWFGLAAFVAICRVTKGSHFPTDILGGLLLGIVTGLGLVYAKSQWQEIGQRTLAHGLPWLVTAFGLVWIIVPHPGIELDPSLSLFLGLTCIVVGLGLRLWRIQECVTPDPHADLKVPTWPRLLMGLGLATSTGSLIIVGSSVLAGIAWWLETQKESRSQADNSINFIAGLNPILTESVIGIEMFLLTLLTFSIRSM